MPNSYFNPDGVLISTTETTIYTAPSATKTMVVLYINNDDTSSRTLNAWVYTGSGPGTDAQLLLPKNYVMTAGARLEIGPLYLSQNYKITAIADVANKINIVPMGIETT